MVATRKGREGAKGSPIAAETMQGWAVFGSKYNETERSALKLFHISFHSIDQELHDLVKEFFFVLESADAACTMESDDGPGKFWKKPLCDRSQECS